jgi:capsular polysaccharide transport system permease protein
MSDRTEISAMGDTDAPPALPRPLTPGAARWRHSRATSALVLREMSSQYGRSPGGYLWAVLEPLGMILFLSLAFSLLLRSPSLGNSFLLFYATGFLPYNLFNKNARVVMNALNYSRNLLRYPAVSWFDAVGARLILSNLTEALVSYIVMVGVLLTIDTRTILDFGAILQAYGLAALLGLGVGLVNCVIFGFLPVWQTIWAILTRPLFLASGIIWIYSDLPPAAANVLWYNPLVHITGLARTGYYPTYEPQYISQGFVAGLALILTALGLLLMRRYHLEILARK